MLVQFMTQFPVILLNGVSFPSPSDLIKLRPLRPSGTQCYDMTCREVVSDVAENFEGRFLYGAYRPEE